jgi:hypothetical protein
MINARGSNFLKRPVSYLDQSKCYATIMQENFLAEKFSTKCIHETKIHSLLQYVCYEFTGAAHLRNLIRTTKPRIFLIHEI